MIDAEQSWENIGQWETISPEQAAAMDPDGDFAKRWLLNGVIFSSLGDVTDARVLDAGSGQGYLSRLLARRGAVVTSIEPAESLFRHSVQMEEQLRQGIELLQEDLTGIQLDRQFDAAVANMVFLSINDWESALKTCANALRPGGRLVFSIEHPMVSAAHNEWRSDGHFRISDYATARPAPKSVAIDFHRPLSAYVNALPRHGLRLERMEEPTLPAEALHDPDAPPHATLLQYVPIFVVIAAVKD